MSDNKEISDDSSTISDKEIALTLLDLNNQIENEFKEIHYENEFKEIQIEVEIDFVNIFDNSKIPQSYSANNYFLAGYDCTSNYFLADYATKLQRKWKELKKELESKNISLDKKQKRSLLDDWENDNFSESADNFIKKRKLNY